MILQNLCNVMIFVRNL